MADRIYIVTSNSGSRLVRASLRSQALAHVANTTFNVRSATQDDLIAELSKGTTVERYRDIEQLTFTEADMAASPT